MSEFWALLSVVVSLAGGFVVGRASERYRRSQALAVELGKARVAAVIRASRILARLERRLGRIVGGRVDDMTLDRSNDPEARFLRERFARDQEGLIADVNAAGDKILEDLAVLGPHGTTVLAYHAAINAVMWAVPNPAVPLARVSELVREVPKARRALSALFPRLDRP